MDVEERRKRIKELEEKAKEKYIGMVEWKNIIEMLPEDEQEEYRRLVKEEETEIERMDKKYGLIDRLMGLVGYVSDTDKMDFIDEAMGLEYVDEKLAETLEELDNDRLEELLNTYEDKV